MSRETDQYKRQLSMLEAYLRGRVIQLEQIGKQQAAESPMCEMARSELQAILDQVLPEMKGVLP